MVNITHILALLSLANTYAAEDHCTSENERQQLRCWTRFSKLSVAICDTVGHRACLQTKPNTTAAIMQEQSTSATAHHGKAGRQAPDVAFPKSLPAHLRLAALPAHPAPSPPQFRSMQLRTLRRQDRQLDLFRSLPLPPGRPQRSTLSQLAERILLPIEGQPQPAQPPPPSEPGAPPAPGPSPRMPHTPTKLSPQTAVPATRNRQVNHLDKCRGQTGSRTHSTATFVAFTILALAQSPLSLGHLRADCTGTGHFDERILYPLRNAT